MDPDGDAEVIVLDKNEHESEYVQVATLVLQTRHGIVLDG